MSPWHRWALCGFLLAACLQSADADSVGPCEVSTWSAWSECSSSCGRGMKTRQRTVSLFGSNCPALNEGAECSIELCPVDCIMSEPSEWSVCSQTCGGGYEQRSRSIIRQNMYGGKSCPEKQEFRYCNTQDCPVDCQLSDWDAFSVCTHSCGGGTKISRRTVTVASEFGGAVCEALEKVAECNTQACHINCEVSNWVLYSTCSRSCGTGYAVHTRIITQHPDHGGDPCPVLSEHKSCNTAECPIDCVVSEFGQWQPCDKSCGGGVRARHRSALVTNAYGGSPCVVLSENANCADEPCPVDCELTPYGDWSECTKSCDSGLQYQQRQISAQPSHGGAHCPASLEVSRHCNKHSCPVDCVLDDVSGWQTCDKSCGGGTQWFGRSIVTKPEFGGIECDMSQNQQTLRACNEEPCAVDCTLSEFTPWTECTKTCGQGSTTRSRHVVAEASMGGVPCPSTLQEITTCNTDCCPGFGHDASGVCQICPVGEYSHQNACVKCKLGTFSNVEGSSSCSECPPATYAWQTGTSECTKCAAGRYADALRRRDVMDCLDCDAGKISTEGSTICEQCEAGSVSEHRTKCTICPVATYANSNACTKCAPGTFSNSAGVSSCEDCEAGQHAAVEGMSACVKCAAGRYSGVGGDKITCESCGAGSGSDEGSSDCASCLPGTFSEGDSECMACADGHSQPEAGKSSCVVCAAGHFSNTEVGLTKCTVCAAGTFSGTGEMECAACPTGQHSREAQSGCSECEAGKFHADGFSNFLYEVGWHGQQCVAYEKCGAGKQLVGHAVHKNGHCEDCASGEYQPEASQWDATCTACAGCPDGQERAGCDSSSDGGVCRPCPVGTFKDDTTGAACQLCEAGQFVAEESSDSCSPCASGYVSQEGSAQCTPCAAGTYHDVAANQCTTCKAGRYSGAAAGSCEDCEKGYYSDAGDPSCTACVPGTYGEGTVQDGDYCALCPQGQYQSASGMSACVECAPGKHSKPLTSVMDSCVDCQAGRYQQSHGAHLCKECAEGTYTNNDGQNSCDSCPSCPSLGQYRHGCGDTSGGTCMQCPQGQYSQVWKCGDHEACPAGKFGAAHEKACHNCPAGTFKATLSTADCTQCEPCPAGHMRVECDAENEGTCQACGPGTFKTAALDWDTSCLVCEKGSYAQLSGASTCSLCPAGRHQDGELSEDAQRCKQCAAGTYAEDQGAVTCAKCASGSYQVDEGSTGCVDCAHGTYNDALGSSRPCMDCPSGKYHVTSDLSCTSCKAGSYLLASGHSEAPGSPDPCFPCEGGRFSPAGAGFCEDCQAGTFEKGDQSECITCPAGYFQKSALQQTCVACESGTHKSFPGSDSECTPCPPSIPASEEFPFERAYWTENQAGAAACDPKPVDCAVGAWNGWSECTLTCGGGRQGRTRSKIHDAWHGLECDDLGLNEVRDCNTADCPADCEVEAWDNWGDCSSPCGGGNQIRTRSVREDPNAGGITCPDLIDTRVCNTEKCLCKAMSCEFRKHPGKNGEEGEYSVHVTHGVLTTSGAADYFTNDGLHHCAYDRSTNKCECTCPTKTSEEYKELQQRQVTGE